MAIEQVLASWETDKAQVRSRLDSPGEASRCKALHGGGQGIARPLEML